MLQTLAICSAFFDSPSGKFSCSALPCPCPALPSPARPCLARPGLALSCPPRPCPALPCPPLSSPVLPYRVVPCPAQPYTALSCIPATVAPPSVKSTQAPRHGIAAACLGTLWSRMRSCSGSRPSRTDQYCRSFSCAPLASQVLSHATYSSYLHAFASWMVPPPPPPSCCCGVAGAAAGAGPAMAEYTCWSSR